MGKGELFLKIGFKVIHLAALGLRCRPWAFSVCDEEGTPLQSGVGSLLIAAALLIVEHRLEVLVCGLSCFVACGVLDQGSNLCRLDLQAGLVTTGPPGKAPKVCLLLEVVSKN